MLTISRTVSIPENDIEITAIRAQGAGGQHVNKVSSAIHLRFDIKASALPDFYKNRLLRCKDSRITKDGAIIIKAQQYRTQMKNRQDALDRLAVLIKKAMIIPKKRKPTQISKSAHRRRLDSKAKRAKVKSLRRRVHE